MNVCEVAGVDELTLDGGCHVDWRPPEMSLQYGVRCAELPRLGSAGRAPAGGRVDLLQALSLAS